MNCLKEGEKDKEKSSGMRKREIELSGVQKVENGKMSCGRLIVVNCV